LILYLLLIYVSALVADCKISS